LDKEKLTDIDEQVVQQTSTNNQSASSDNNNIVAITGTEKFEKIAVAEIGHTSSLTPYINLTGTDWIGEKSIENYENNLTFLPIQTTSSVISSSPTYNTVSFSNISPNYTLHQKKDNLTDIKNFAYQLEKQQHYIPTLSKLKFLQNDNYRDIPRKTFVASGGQCVYFIDDSCKKAMVEENLPKPFKRTLYLKVRKENSTLRFQDIRLKTTAWHQYHIHVCLPENDPQGNGYVYIGTGNKGLLGGMKGGGGGPNSNFTDPSNLLQKLLGDTFNNLLHNLTIGTFLEFRAECTRLGDTWSRFWSLLNEPNDIPDYDAMARESTKRIQEETAELIDKIRALSRQAENKREIKEEKNKKEAVEFEEFVKSMRANIQKAKEIAEKRGKFFIRDGEISDVKSIKEWITDIQKELSKVSINARLSQEYAEEIRFIIGGINDKRKELKEFFQIISYNIYHPDECCRMDYDKEDLQITIKLLEDLKNYKEEIRQLLAARGEKLSDYDPEAPEEDEKTENILGEEAA
jgi:hypothetical protein